MRLVLKYGTRECGGSCCCGGGGDRCQVFLLFDTSILSCKIIPNDEGCNNSFICRFIVRINSLLNYHLVTNSDELSQKSLRDHHDCDTTE